MAIGTLLFVVCVFIAAFFFRNKPGLCLFFIFLGGVALRFFLSSDPFLHDWDERYHALVAKNLMAHPLKPTLYDNPLLPFDYKIWVDGHVWVHKQPLPLWLMAASMKVFGVSELALRLPSIMLSSFAILLTYAVARHLFSVRIGLFAAFLHAIHGLIIELTAGRAATDHIDLHFLFFIELGVYFSVLYYKNNRQYFNVLTGIAIGLAVLCKWLPAFIVIPLWLCINYKRQSKWMTVFSALLTLLTACLIFLPWQFFIFHAYPQEAKWEFAFNTKHITEVLENHSGPFYYHFDNMRILFGEFIYIPFVWLIYKFFKRKNLKQRGFLLVWILLPYLFFSIPKTKMQAYVIFCAPAFFILSAYFFSYLSYIKSRLKTRVPVYILQAAIVILPLRYSFERMKFFDEEIRKTPEWVTELKSLKEKLPENSVVFNHPRSIEGMFYTDMIFYNKIPNKAEVELIQSKNFHVVILSKEELPQEIKSVPGIVQIR